MSDTVETIHYRIRPLDPAAHLYQVLLRVPDPDPVGQRLYLPAWIPGSYLIRDFARHIVSLRAFCGDRPIACRKLDKSSWQCEPVAGPLSVECEIYAWDLSVRTAHLDDTHGYFNGTSMFLAVAGQEDRACRLSILPPEGEGFDGWQVATTLRPAAGTLPWNFGDYLADDYADLVDHPVETGRFTRVGFTAGGIPHHIVLTGVHRADTERLSCDLRRICETQLRFFGAPVPIDRYLFLVMLVNEGYGGLEHRCSTSLLAARDDLPQIGDHPESVKDAYRSFLGLCSHEYFHLWLVKRIRPEVFVAPDLSREAYTRQLWIFEGFTSYYDDLMLLRAGVIDEAGYLELLGQTITRVLRTPGRRRQSVADSAFDAWTKFYRPDENTPNAVVSYYTKGAVLALLLDAGLRDATKGKASLDDVMRELWRRHGVTGIGLPEDGLRRLVTALGGDAFDRFFDQYVDGTDDPPLATLLVPLGIELHLRAAEGPTDNGGRPGCQSRPRASLGARIATDQLGARLQHCFAGGAAMRSGLSAGDVIVAIDGLRVTAAGIEKSLARYRPGETVTVHAFRRDELRELRLRFDEAALDTAWLSRSVNAETAVGAWPGAGGEG